MNAQIRQYLAELGKRGGSATSTEKTAAVRANGAKGGRPRKDGMPPGSKPLEEVLEWIETSNLPKQAKLDFSVDARWRAPFFKAGQPWLDRDQVLKIKSLLRTSSKASKRVVK